MTTPTPPEDGGSFGPPLEPPPSPGPWTSDNLPPNPLAGAAQTMERPPGIRNAVNLMYVGAGLSALQILVSFFLIDSFRDQIREDNPDFTENEVNSGANISLAFAVVVGLVAIGLWLWMAHENGEGKSWARIVATVFGGLGILGSLFTLLGGGMGASLFAVINLVLAIVILVMLYRRDSSEYFRVRSSRG
jgi:O-antigen/teichoic acid export membrane protein